MHRYDEPHGWMMSVRQTLGALLAEQGRYQEATRVFREDLALFPENIWALTGSNDIHHPWPSMAPCYNRRCPQPQCQRSLPEHSWQSGIGHALWV